jgi:hypothetical protein
LELEDDDGFSLSLVVRERKWEILIAHVIHAEEASESWITGQTVKE